MSSRDRGDAERRRLAALESYQLLDSVSDPAFDAFAKLAATICETPVGLVSLIDADRQWFKANFGLHGVRETERSVAFCSHAIETPDLFEIDDATLDPRFADNRLVTGQPFLRFYAGMPLIDSHGHALGTICVLDREPRHLTVHQQNTLKDLATSLMAIIEPRLGATPSDLEQQAMYNTALENAPEPMVLLVIDHNDHASITYANRAFSDVFGYATAEIIGKPTSAVFGAKTEAAHIRSLHAGSEKGGLVSQHVTLYTKAGDERLVEVRDRAIDTHHRIVSFRDLTPLHTANEALLRANERFESLLANDPDAAVLTLDAAGACLAANDTAVKMFGYERSQLIGSGYLQLSDVSIFPNGDQFLAASGGWQPLRFSRLYRRGDGAIISCDCKAIPMIVRNEIEGAYLIVKDVTQTLELGKRLDRDGKRLRALYEISAVGNATYGEQVDAALALVLDAFDMEYGYVGKIEDQTLVLQHVAGESFPVGARFELKETYVADTLAFGDVLAVADLAAAAETSDHRSNRPRYTEWHGYISAPLFVDRAPYGAIGFLSKNVIAFDDMDRDFMRLVTSLISTVLERERRQKRLDQLAFFDTLTGLANRGNFMLQLEAALLAAATAPASFAIHFIDLDGFKNVNDRFGHAEGDAVLQEVARRLERTLRGTADVAARLGGDEFVILQTNVANRLDAVALGKRLVASLSKPYARLADLQPALSASVGIALYPSDGDDVRTLLAEADRALYLAKANGKGCVEMHKPRRLRAVR